MAISVRFSVGGDGKALLEVWPPFAMLLRTLAWTKWLLLFTSLCVGVFAIWNHLSEVDMPPHEGQIKTRSNRRATAPEDLAICCSGGGIRSAGFTLGAMRELELKGVTAQAKTIAAVSGGNYAATSWVIHRSVGRQRPAHHLISQLYGGIDPFEEEVSIEDFDVRNWSPQGGVASEEDDPRNRGLHRYLANGPGGLFRGGFFVLLAILFNTVVLSAVVILFAWPAGRFVRSHVLFGPPGIKDCPVDQLVDCIEVGSSRYWGPGTIYLGLGLGLLALAAWKFSPPPPRSGLAAKSKPDAPMAHWTWRLPGLIRVAAMAGVVLLILNVLGPFLLREVIRLSNNQSFLIGVGLGSFAVLLAAVLGLAGNLFQRVVPRLGGAALIILGLLLFGRVAHDAAVDGHTFSAPVWWVLAGVITLLTGVTFDIQPISLRELYRNRLANSFMGKDHNLLPAKYIERVLQENDSPGLTWEALDRVDLPELVVCCSASRVGLAPWGVQAESFTISPVEVIHRQADLERRIPTRDYVKSLKSPALQPLRGPAGWMATSGAAISSALGRNSVGSAGALLAALNVSLGAWVPAVRAVPSPHSMNASHQAMLTDPPEPANHPPLGMRWLAKHVRPEPGDLPPPGLGLLVSEILGLYDPQTLYTYVSDGGHYENLGLVELLQRGYRRVICLDASNDSAGTYQTLHDALDIADTSVKPRLHFDREQLERSSDRASIADRLVYTIPFCPWDDRHSDEAKTWGVIYYAKLQEAQTLPIKLREYLNINRGAPRVTTANQVLNDNQFLFLVLAGRVAGQELSEKLRGDLKT
ncbi:MAG: hypothetical protein ACRBK7_30845 [Acidimicrobiales bacterium]